MWEKGQLGGCSVDENRSVPSGRGQWARKATTPSGARPLSLLTHSRLSTRGQAAGWINNKNGKNTKSLKY